MPEHVPNTVLVHRDLPAPTNTTTVPDTRDGYLSGLTLIQDSGGAWDWAPLPPDAEPGLAPVANDGQFQGWLHQTEPEAPPAEDAEPSTTRARKPKADKSED